MAQFVDNQDNPTASGAAGGGLSLGAAGQSGAGLDGSSFGSGFNFDSQFGTSAIGTTNNSGSALGTAFGVNQLSNFGLSLGTLGAFGSGAFRGGAFGQQQSQQQNQNRIRAKVTVGFAYSPPVPQQVEYNANTTLAKLPLPARFQDVEVRMDGTTAILQGTPRPQADIDLLTQLLLLEPGVYKVDSEALTEAAPLIPPPVAAEPVPPPQGF